jgi:hypothetical protein
MKRFCETTRFDDPFYSSLPAEMKLAREYITAKCDNAGVWMPNFALADFQIGMKVEWDDFRARLESAGELMLMSNGSWLIKWFIPTQYGELKDSVNLHRSVLLLLKKHGLEQSNDGIVMASRCHQTHPRVEVQTEVKVTSGKGSGENQTPTLEEVTAYGAGPNASVPSHVCEAWWNEHEARPRHASGGYTDKQGALVFDWKAALRGYAGKWRQNDLQRKPAGNGKPTVAHDKQSKWGI